MPKRRADRKFQLRKRTLLQSFKVKNESEKSTDNHPKTVPGGSLGMPGELPGASRELVGTILETQRRCMQNLKHPGHVPEPIQVPSRAQPGPRNRQKTDLCPKRLPRGASPEASVDDFEGQCRCGSIFGLKNYVFSRFFYTLSVSQRCESRILCASFV